MYADDTVLLLNLVINKEKTKYLVYGRKAKYVVLEEAKYLNITIEQKLTWIPLIDNLFLKLTSNLYVFNRIKCIGTF